MARAVRTRGAETAPARASRTRRQRGYHWEDTLVKRFRGAGGWRAFRLGSPSTGLPDVLAVNTQSSTLYSIEAKSGTGMSLAVPPDQIGRCLEWAAMFDIYKRRRVLLAFKFISKKRVGAATYEPRQLREYYKVWDPSLGASECVCTYDGATYLRDGGARREVALRECPMPFATRQPSAKAGRRL